MIRIRTSFGGSDAVNLFYHAPYPSRIFASFASSTASDATTTAICPIGSAVRVHFVAIPFCGDVRSWSADATC